MIVDHLKNIALYKNVHPSIDSAIEYIQKTDLESVPTGKHPILGTEHSIIRENYEPRGIESCFFEGHHLFADIQIVLKGYEYIGYANKDAQNIKITDPYIVEKDLEKYEIKDFTRVILTEGMFAIVFPDDLHMPKLAKDLGVEVKKAVIKVKL